MKKRDQKRLTKLIFAILARNPFEFGIVPDEGGWISIKDVRWALGQQGAFKSLSVRGLQQFFELYSPEKMEMRDRSVRVLPEYQSSDLLQYRQVDPPSLLYLPVRPRAHAHVVQKGLVPPAGKKWIVLWPDKELALNAGRRRDARPLIGTVNTAAAQAQGALFFRAGESLFLVQWLQASWIELPPVPEKPERKAKQVSAGNDAQTAPQDVKPGQLPGSFIPEFPSMWPEWYGHSDEKARRRQKNKKYRKDRKGRRRS